MKKTPVHTIVAVNMLLDRSRGWTSAEWQTLLRLHNRSDSVGHIGTMFTTCGYAEKREGLWYLTDHGAEVTRSGKNIRGISSSDKRRVEYLKKMKTRPAEDTWL